MRSLYWAFGLVVAFAALELLGAYLSGSLSLASDGVHMTADLMGMSIAVAASRIAGRLSRGRDKRRVEGRAAYWSMTMLSLVALLIMGFSLWRFFHPVPIESRLMLSVAALGLIANAVVLALLHKGRKESLNLKAAHFHVASDTLTSVGVLGAALLIWMTGYLWIDAAVSFLIGAVIFLGARHLRAHSKEQLLALKR
ncbi:MAG: cation diffusion facilitator family transporter [bacterium]|nr:cation diffusion facilitator family transporter [bacterium]